MRRPRAEQRRAPVRAKCAVGVWIAATFLAACAIPTVVEKDVSYPAGWPEIAVSGTECSGIEGAFVNKGTFADRAGHTREVWLTNVLFLDELPAPNEARLRDALRRCERVSLRLESSPKRALLGPDSKDWKLFISASHPTSGPLDSGSVVCGELRQPSGPAVAQCEVNYLLIVRAHHNPFVIPPSTIRRLTLDAEGSLIVKLEGGETRQSPKGWARFQRLP